MATDLKVYCLCVCVCARAQKGIGWGFGEIGGCIVVCASELQRAIKMEGDVSHWNACLLFDSLSLCVCVSPHDVLSHLKCINTKGCWYFEKDVCGYLKEMFSFFFLSLGKM